MNHPKLKYPKLCRILTYVVVLGCAAIPIVAVCLLPIPDILKALVIIASIIGLLIYLIKHFLVLMAMDMTLAMLSCYQTARKQYTLPPSRSADAIRHSIVRYGMQCQPLPSQPQPAALRYTFSAPMTVYSRGIERVVAAYEVDLLDKDTYRSIFSSAKANSNALKGQKKAKLLDKEQKKQSLHRVTVILILAHNIDPQLTGDLYELVCRSCGNEEEDCIVPCVVDLAHHTCVFNCVRSPYVGLGYPAKNRGIRIIKRRVFGGTWNLQGNAHFITPKEAIDLDDSLWDLWKKFRHQLIGIDKESKRLFETMFDKEIRIADETLYLKWDQRGICQIVELDTEGKIAKVEHVTDWAYPKSQSIGKQLIQKMEDQISAYYAKQGYTVEFVDLEAMM